MTLFIVRMDIVAINNQVVVMRGAVKQAKVHTIRKLSRQAKTLRAKKGNEDQLTKNNRKADRMVKEISTMKELNIDEVSKFALSNRYTIKTITKEMADDLKIFCMTKLAEHKAIMSSVIKCREKFDNWGKELPQLLKMCEVRKLFKLTHQTPGKFRKKPKSKKSRPMNSNNWNSKRENSPPEMQAENWNFKRDVSPQEVEAETEINLPLPQNEMDNLEEEYESCDEDCASAVNRSDSLNDSANEGSQSDGEAKLQMPTKKTFVKVTKKHTQVVTKDKPATPTQVVQTVEKRAAKPIVVATKRLGEMEIKRFFLSETEERTSMNDEDLLPKIVCSSNTESEDGQKKIKPKCKDSFFVRNDDDSLSEADVKSEESDSDMPAAASKTSNPMLESSFIGSLRERADAFPQDRKFNKVPNRNWQKPHETKFGSQRRDQPGRNYGSSDLSTFQFQSNRKQRRQHLSAPQQQTTVSAATAKPESLHPSWDAKKKLKMQSQIHQFQGKKIKFDD